MTREPEKDTPPYVMRISRLTTGSKRRNIIAQLLVLTVLACQETSTDPLVTHPDIAFYGEFRTTDGAPIEGQVIAQERSALVGESPCSKVLSTAEARVLTGQYSVVLRQRTTTNSCTIIHFIPERPGPSPDSVVFPYPSYLEQADSIVGGVVYLRADWVVATALSQSHPVQQAQAK